MRSLSQTLLGDPGALTLHLSGRDRVVRILDDRGVLRGRMRLGRSIELEDVAGETIATAGPPAGLVTHTYAVAWDEGAGTQIAARSGRVASVPGGLAYRWPLLQLRAVIPEAIVAAEGERRARILAAALGVRLEMDAELAPRDRILALLIYGVAALQLLPPPSVARYLVPRSL